MVVANVGRRAAFLIITLVWTRHGASLFCGKGCRAVVVYRDYYNNSDQDLHLVLVLGVAILARVTVGRRR